jgi:glycosyltransferase involved in cell wall biosynthesis
MSVEHPAHPPRVAVLIPCHNEAPTIGEVVRAFRAELPDSDIYVYDNASTDGTHEEAERAGAVVRVERRKGKGHVLQRMFREVEADVYVMVDGDATYPADRVMALIAPVARGEADMVVGSRLTPGTQSEFRLLNRIGNLVYRFLLNAVFRVEVTDLLSGYRAMSRGLVKSLPLFSQGFETETELTIKCLARRYRIVEVPVDLVARPEGSVSKIRLVGDGVAILHTLVALVRDYKPLTAFGLMGLVLVGLGLLPGFVVARQFVVSGDIRNLPAALLAAALVLAGLLMGFTGMVLHAIARHFQEVDAQLRALLEAQRHRSS